MNIKYLTTSKFKIALECPTKLYYSEHKEKYAKSKLDDPFFGVLAKGDLQVRELVKCYPDGHNIVELDYESSNLIEVKSKSVHPKILKNEPWNSQEEAA